MKARKRLYPDPCKNCGYDRVGRTDRVDLGDYGFLIQCPRCRTKSKIGLTVDDAVIAWNSQMSEYIEVKRSNALRRQKIRENLMRGAVDRKIEEARRGCGGANK